MVMKECLTKQSLFPGVSGCLVEKPECNYAHKFGFSFECRHPDHRKFHAHVAGVEKKGEVLELYNTLRRKRRDEYTANLDEASREFFCFEPDVLGQFPAMREQAPACDVRNDSSGHP